MSKKIWMAVIVIVVVLAIVYGVKNNKGSQGGVVKIGFIGPLTGGGASYGETERNATMLAVDEINSSGGIDGKQISVIYQDGKCIGKDATDAIQKLVSIDRVGIVMGGTCSAETLAAAPIAEANHVILLSAFSSNPAITNAGDYIFRNSPSDSDVGKLDADVMAQKFKKVAIISENTDYSQGVRGVMKTVFQEKDITITSDEIYNTGATDFRTILIKIKQSNPEALYINPSATKDGGNIVKQARELGITIPFYGNFSLGTPDALKIGGDRMNGIIISDSSQLSSRGAQVLEKYKQRFSADPSNQYEMGAAYDRVYILKNAILAVGESPNKIKDYLYRMPDFNGAVGTYHFDSNGDVVGVGFTNFKLEGGKEIRLTNN